MTAESPESTEKGNASMGISGGQVSGFARPGWLSEIGHPPEPMISTPNPAHEIWIERAALRLCDDADELGEIPTPCAVHLREARTLSQNLRTVIVNAR